MSEDQSDNTQVEEQLQLAREIGEELTDAFVAYVQGDVSFEDLTFGVFDALSDLHVIAGGDYELTGDDEQEQDDDLVYDESEATEEQEDLAQEPSRS